MGYKDGLFAFHLKLHRKKLKGSRAELELELKLEFEWDFEVELQLSFIMKKKKCTLIKTQSVLSSEHYFCY